jgi:hypothetical protein
MNEPRYRYILSCKIGDYSASAWVTVGDAAAGLMIRNNEMKKIALATPAEQFVKLSEK